MSVGRRPLADDLGLVGTAVKVDQRGFVEVDELCRTGEPGVFAIGDLINTPQLAHVGFAEAIMVVKEILGENPLPVMYDRVPWAIYCHPEVAFAGHSEEAAKEAGFDVVASKHQYRGNSRAQIIGETEGLVKVIAEKQPDGTGGRILGVHMVGPWVTEQLGQGYLAVNWEATVAEVAEFIQPHPDAVGAVRRDGALAHRKEPARLMADVTMPQLGETVTEGTITTWFKQVGDEVEADEPLFEVSTDKVDTEVPSPIAGVLTEIKANEGDVVEVGAVIAVVGDAGSAPAAAPDDGAQAAPRRPGGRGSPRRPAAAQRPRPRPRRRRRPPPLPSPSPPRALGAEPADEAVAAPPASEPALEAVAAEAAPRMATTGCCRRSCAAW